jgi:hypothetical protein
MKNSMTLRPACPVSGRPACPLATARLPRQLDRGSPG